MNQQKIYNEIMTIESMRNLYTGQFGGEYFTYSSNMANACSSIEAKIMNIIGFNGENKVDLANYLSKVQTNDDQNKHLFEVRKMPVYKRIMGEYALQQKQKLEALLNVKIDNEGNQVLSDNINAAVVAYKNEDTLYAELETNSKKLQSLLNEGKITEEQYTSLDMNLDRIYIYYISQTKGEQILLRKISDADYKKIEDKAMENGIEVSEQISKINEDMLYEHEQIQNVSNGMNR